MRVAQRDIVEVNFEMPDGSMKVHPALVLSNDTVLDTEEIFYAVMISTKEYNDDFTFELNDEMVTKPLRKKSFVKCQLIQAYRENEILVKISSVKINIFKEIKNKIFESVF